MDAHQIFNRKLLDFVEDLKTLRADMRLDLPELDLLRPGINLVINTIGHHKPQEVFDEQVASRYGSRILERDEAFLLDETYDHVHADLDAVDVVGLIDVLKKAWKDIDPQNKEAVWRHLAVLLLLNQRCLDQDADT